MTTAVSVRTVRNSPFRESEWDSRLDHLLEDLENSAQRSHSAERTNTVTTSSYKATASSAASASCGVLSKSKSTSSLTGAATDNMLKDLDTALKASTNYIESHRRVELPNGHQEYHESRYTSTSGVPPSSGDFNLERQVQHMMPSNYASSSSHSSQQQQQQFNSGLQSANMVSSMQTSTSKQSYTSYKVQSNAYTSRNLDFQTDQEQERPGSRLKANIDELDTLLSDLNNAQTTNNSSRQHHHETSSEDYGDHAMQGHVKKTITSMNEYTMSSGTSGDYHRKPPSPSPVRRTPVMSSPVPRRTSPSPAACRKASPPSGPSMMSNTMSASSNYSYNYNSSRHSSPPRKRSPSPRLDSGTPTGHAYYSKYHSSYSQQKQGGPASFPTCPSPSPNRGPSVQTPPKKVDDLMTELSEFDPSIRHTGFTEPVAPARSHNKYSSNVSHVQTVDLSEELDSRYNKREPSPIKPPTKQPSHPGPAVYYPPGELFSSTRNNETLNSEMSHSPAVPAPGQASHATTMETSSSARGRAKMRAEYGYKEKGRYSEGDTKQGAAVVPICLPLCCAAPCVIL